MLNNYLIFLGLCDFSANLVKGLHTCFHEEESIIMFNLKLSPKLIQFLIQLSKLLNTKWAGSWTIQAPYFSFSLSLPQTIVMTY